jgi:hypothetical protein
MGTTNLDWLEVSGVPTLGMGGGPYAPMSNWIFVDANNFTGASADGNPGTADAPVTTMSRAFELVKSGGVISFMGNIREQLTTPEGIFGVTIIGAATQPRNADSFSGGTSNDGGRTGASWVSPASATAATPLLTVLQQGWRFQNFLWGAGPANTATVQLYRDGGAGDEERDASHASFYGIYFSGCVDAIETSGGLTGVQVDNCLFRGITGVAFQSITGAGIGTNLNYNITGCRFLDCVNGIVGALNAASIRNNIFGAVTTAAVDLTGGATNMVGPGNIFTGTYNTVCSPGTNDVWAGNFQIGGITTANPT